MAFFSGLRQKASDAVAAAADAAADAAARRGILVGRGSSGRAKRSSSLGARVSIVTAVACPPIEHGGDEA